MYKFNDGGLQFDEPPKRRRDRPGLTHIQGGSDHSSSESEENNGEISSRVEEMLEAQKMKDKYLNQEKEENLKNPGFEQLDVPNKHIFRGKDLEPSDEESRDQIEVVKKLELLKKKSTFKKDKKYRLSFPFHQPPDHPNQDTPGLENFKEMVRKVMEKKKTTGGILFKVEEHLSDRFHGDQNGLKNMWKSEKKQKGPYAVSSKNAFWFFWDIFVLYYYIFESIKLTNLAAFKITPTGLIFNLKYAVNSAEILLNFVRATKYKMTIRNSAMNYVKFLFWLDFLALIDLYRLNYWFILFQLVKLRQILRGAFTLEYFISLVLNWLFTQHYSKVYGRFFTLIVLAGVSIHLLCLAVLNKQFKFAIEAFMKTGKESIAYLNGIFYIITTITTVGYGKLVPVQWLSMILSMTLEFIGIILYGYVFQQVVKLIQDTQSYHNMKMDRQENLESWLIAKEKMQTGNKNRSVIMKTQQAFEFVWNWDIEDVFSDSFFFFRLSPSLREEVSEGPMNFIMKYFSSFFKMLEYNHGLAICHSLQPKLFVEGEIVAKKNEFSCGIYFIIKGTIEISHKFNPTVPVMTYSEGSFFGENFILNEPFQRKYQVVSKDLRCLFLLNDSFMTHLGTREDVINTLKSIALFKKIALSVEDSKFDDVVQQVLQKMIDLKKKTLNERKIKTKRKFKKDAIFKGLIAKAVEDLMGNDPMFQSQKYHIDDYLNMMTPDKNLDALANIKRKIALQKHDMGTFVSSSGDEFSHNTEPLEEPEPEILTLERGAGLLVTKRSKKKGEADNVAEDYNSEQMMNTSLIDEKVGSQEVLQKAKFMEVKQSKFITDDIRSRSSHKHDILKDLEYLACSSESDSSGYEELRIKEVDLGSRNQRSVRDIKLTEAQFSSDGAHPSSKYIKVLSRSQGGEKFADLERTRKGSPVKKFRPEFDIMDSGAFDRKLVIKAHEPEDIDMEIIQMSQFSEENQQNKAQRDLEMGLHIARAKQETTKASADNRAGKESRLRHSSRENLEINRIESKPPSSKKIQTKPKKSSILNSNRFLNSEREKLLLKKSTRKSNNVKFLSSKDVDEDKNTNMKITINRAQTKDNTKTTHTKLDTVRAPQSQRNLGTFGNILTTNANEDDKLLNSFRNPHQQIISSKFLLKATKYVKCLTSPKYDNLFDNLVLTNMNTLHKDRMEKLTVDGGLIEEQHSESESEAYFSHDNSSDESSEDYPINNFKPRKYKSWGRNKNFENLMKVKRYNEGRLECLEMRQKDFKEASVAELKRLNYHTKMQVRSRGRKASFVIPPM